VLAALTGFSSSAVTQFHGFFNFCDMEPVMESFCAYHINAPGQEPDAEPLPQGFVLL
jgi:Ndr family